jgi:hypothetical protein
MSFAVKQQNNTDQAVERQPDQVALSSGPPLPSAAVLLDRRDQLEREADTLREQAEALRDDADVRRKETAIAAIDKQLSDRGVLYQPEDAARWGVEIAKAVYDTGVSGWIPLFDSRWLTNGQIAWGVDSVPPAFRNVSRDGAADQRFEAELLGSRYSIDLTAVIGVGERHNDRTFSDFASAAGTVRFDDLYWRAVQASGDAVSVVRISGASNPLCLVAFRDGKITAVAMPITMDTPSRPVGEATP